MEYSPSGAFVDAPTAGRKARLAGGERHAQREGRSGRRSHQRDDGRYRLQSGAFGAGNLKASWKDHTGATRVWHPGDVDARNLGGLTYSLDNISKDTAQGPRTSRAR